MTMLKRSENIVTVSSDVDGFFANPERVQHVYKMAGFNTDIELVLMPYQIYYLNQMAKGAVIPFDVGGFHGQLGTAESFRDHEKGLPDWLLINLFDSLLPNLLEPENPLSGLSTLQKVEKAAQYLNKDLYFNVHQDSVDRRYRDYLIGSTIINHHSKLAIENGPGSKDTEKTKVLIKRLKADGAERVEGTFDIVHAVVGLIHGAVPDMAAATKIWDRALKSIDENFTRLHLPVGKRANDSLPIMEMLKEKKMLRELGDYVGNLGLEITLENQSSLLFGVTEIWTEVERLKRIHDGLQESGIIK